MKLFLHNNGSNNTAITGFAVIYTDSYLSLEIFFWRCLAMAKKLATSSTDALMIVYKFSRHIYRMDIAGREQ